MKTLSDQHQNQFKEHIVMTINELASFLNVSIRTVQRKLKQWKTIRSYDKNGRYYALEEIAKFNVHGIWEYKKIHFSKYGNLKKSLIEVIKKSKSGMNAVEIREVLGMDTRSFLFHYNLKLAS
jgi:transcriptional antiterminator